MSQSLMKSIVDESKQNSSSSKLKDTYHRKVIEKLFTIVDKDRKTIPMVFNSAQEYYYNGWTNRDIILKARQLGFSSLILAIWLVECFTVPNTNAVVVSHETEATQRLFARVRSYIKRLNEAGYQLRTSYERKDYISFPETDSTFYIGTAGSKTFGRGDTINLFHASELAFWETPEQLMLGIMEAVTPNGRIVIESTANGLGNYFRRLWVRSENNSGSFKTHFFPWFMDPSYRRAVDDDFKLTSEEKEIKDKYHLDLEQLAWRRWKIADMARQPQLDAFHQEYPAEPEEAFIASGKTYFSVPALKFYKDIAKTPISGILTFKNDSDLRVGHPIFVPQEDGIVKIWKPPIPNRNYAVGCDVAEGDTKKKDGGDNSVAYALDRQTLEFVASVVCQIDPDIFAKESLKLAYYYNVAYLATEVNGPGVTVNKRFSEQQGSRANTAYDRVYPHLYFREIYDDILHKISLKPGWKTNLTSRHVLIEDFAAYVRELQVKVFDKEAIEELFTFVLREKKMEAEKGELDDRVFAMAIALQVHKLCPIIKFPSQPVMEPKSEMERRLLEFQKRIQSLKKKNIVEDRFLGSEF
jgi:hypothetical protein